MKKRITVLFVLLAAVCGAAGAFAQSESDFEVTVENGAVTITKYKGSAVAVVIPASIGGLPVVGIGDDAFLNRKDLTSVSMPTGVTSIGESAFWGCTSLITISIPASVTSIETVAFLGCTSLISISIPAGVTSIGNYAFSGCTGLTAIQVNTDNKNYTSSDGVLFNKTGNTLIKYPAAKKERQYAIPASVTSIEADAFDNCLFDQPVARHEEKNLLVGLDRQLNPLEILYNEVDEHTVNVFHAMKCRGAWRNLAKLEEKLWQE